ncbi:succinate dehydrogenase cytochrome b subunit [Corynebacterium kroppenstedtii]|uniref:succinate dehydrogenase cytochrome b subunit n=1 Tax=Corynebacterium sp. PCR 32 TaxID=3351342 RepID=UPI0030AF6F97
MTVKNANRDAVAHGKITTEPLRDKPAFPSWAMKLTMAITGIIFGLFVLVHMIGNLKIYMGAQHYDDYAEFLRTMLEPLLPREGILWIFRMVLLACLVLHVYCGIALHGRARKSRGKFRRTGLVTGMNTFAARSMVVTGLVLLLFIIFHILDLTIGVRPIGSNEFEENTAGHAHAYANLIHSFERPGVAIFYILAMVILFVHLSHGIWTAISDLGITGHRWRQAMLLIAYIVPAIIMIGNISIPVAVLTGAISL